MARSDSLTAGVLGAAIVLLAGCSGSSGGHVPFPQPAMVGLPITSPLPSCVNALPKQPRPVATAIARDFSDDRLVSSLSLDGGRLQAVPARKDVAPEIGPSLALCNLLAGTTANNSSMLEGAAEHGMSFGLAVVSVADSVLKSGPHLYLTGGSQQTSTLAPYHSRLAWIAVTEPDVETSCPGMAGPPSPSPTDKPLPPYEVQLIDAMTGTGVDYFAKTNNSCGFAGYEAPRVIPAAEFVSLPWTLVSRGPGPKAATIRYEPRPCDLRDFGMFVTKPPAPGRQPTGPLAVFADRDHPGLVSVSLERLLTNCGAGVPTHLLLRSATLATDLPQRLIHAPVGAMDVPE